MRGEHTALQTYGGRLQGSSPHARGTPVAPRCTHPNTGIIPACAGNTTLYPNVSVMTWDHPRMRGEHMAKSTNCCKSLGSSPHARGTRLYYGKQLFQQGIIPACAGNTRSASWRPPNCRDHPRMRGEHMRLLRKPSPPQGSSPHARGTRFRHMPAAHVPGIIPACAGNT